MRLRCTLCFKAAPLVLLTAAAAPMSAQKHELGLLLGVNSAPQRDLRLPSPGDLKIDSGLTYVVNYGVRVAGGTTATLYFEVQFVATPLLNISSTSALVPRDYASLFLTPGLRLKFVPGFVISPYVAVGGGYAQFEQSASLEDGSPNAGARRTHRGAVDFGGGVDVRLWRWLSLRGEVRDFHTGNPAYNVGLSGGQHNIVAAGGFAVRWGE